jgi:glycosyltransferase involved in cell wall biosynthesis
MRIVVATTTAFHLRYLATELLGAGEEVTFCSYLPRWKTRQYGLPDNRTRSMFFKLQPSASLALWRGGGRRLRALREKLLASADRAAAEILPPCDVFIGLSSMAIESARRARNLYGAHIIIERGSSHVLEQERILAEAGGTQLSDNYVRRELASYSEADTVVVPSKFAARSFLDRGFPAERLKVIMLGADTAKFTPSAIAPPHPVRALFVGQWSRRKGADLLAAALQAIPGLQLTHVGLQLDVEFPEHAGFRSLGYLSHEALREVLSQHHLLVLPSREDGFGMVMTEALAAGLRVVASTATGGPDLAETIGPQFVRTFVAGSLDALVGALQGQVSEIENNPAGYRPTAEETAMLSWRAYGERYRNMLASLEMPGT